MGSNYGLIFTFVIASEGNCGILPRVTWTVVNASKQIEAEGPGRAPLAAIGTSSISFTR